MNDVLTAARRWDRTLPRAPIYYGWVVLGVAALAMVATLPGRTQGLGLITESLLKDLKLERVTYAQMNLWATLTGSLFCLGIGRLVDQLGSRVVLAAVSLCLGCVVLAMSWTNSVFIMFCWLILTRGLGQSALSVVSLTMVGQWFARRLNAAMAAYSLLLSIGFMLAFPIVGSAVISFGWRSAWSGMGWFLVLPLVPIALLLVRRGPEEGAIEMRRATSDDEQAGPDFMWSEALWTPAFWVFAIASSLYNLIASGIGLFNESILVELGFDAGMYHRSLVVTALTSLVGNFLGGWLASKWNVNRLMTLAMALLAAALLGLPSLKTQWQVYLFAVVMGVAGGFVIVIFFSFWAKTFGRAQLGRIQGTAQMMTVLSSAVGPLLLAKCYVWTGSYSAVFYILAGIVALTALTAAWVKLPESRIPAVTP
jgi:MFS family permease